MLAGTKFVLVPQRPTVPARWSEEKKKKHVNTLMVPCVPLAEGFQWHQEAKISFKRVSICIPGILFLL